MANPQADGRMINRAISDSDKFASLSPEAAVLFTMIIPWFNAHGKMNGGAGYIKDEICPKVQYLTYQNIPELLKEISEKTNVKWFQFNGRYWLHSLSFNSEHQKLDKKGVDKLPSFSTELVPDKSPTTPEPVEIKSPLNTKDNTNTKAKGTPELDTPVDNSPAEEKLTDEKTAFFLKELKTAIDGTLTRHNSVQEQLEITNWIKQHLRTGNPQAIIHCINQLPKAPEKVKKLTSYLDAAFKIEDGKYNAADSEKRCNEYKNQGIPEEVATFLSGLFKPMPAAAH